MPADYLIERMDAIWPTLLSASRNALSLKQEVGSITRPHANFLRLAGRPGIRDLLQAVLPEVTAIIGKPDWRTVQTFRDPFFDRLDGGVQVPLGIGGYPDHRVIASTDGIFIVKPGHEDEAKNWYPENAPAGLQIPGQRTYPTLRFSA
jgi:hypothetical protein